MTAGRAQEYPHHLRQSNLCAKHPSLCAFALNTPLSLRLCVFAFHISSSPASFPHPHHVIPAPTSRHSRTHITSFPRRRGTYRPTPNSPCTADAATESRVGRSGSRIALSIAPQDVTSVLNVTAFAESPRPSK